MRTRCRGSATYVPEPARPSKTPWEISSSLGLPARVEEHDRYTSVEAAVPESLSSDLWRDVLEVAAEADRFGLLTTSMNDRTLWAVVHKAVPTTGDVGGPSHQR